jgi:hypothetical protein
VGDFLENSALGGLNAEKMNDYLLFEKIILDVNQ